MDNTVIVDANRTSCFDAVNWCTDQFGPDMFDINNQFPSWNWAFTFKRPQDATVFALKWV
jgi:hypothetical protein